MVLSMLDDSVALWLSVLLGGYAIYLSNVVIYNIYFHPLAKIPGPKLWAATRLRYIFSLVRGNIVQDVRRIHETYGDVVRLAPNDVSFAREDAYNDIHLRRPGQPAFDENPIYFSAPPGQPDNMITTANHEAHARMRKVMSHSFTEKALKAQEPIIESYVSLFISRLKEKATAPGSKGHGTVVDIVDWFNYVAFDIVGDLCFGEPFDCLKHDALHPWIAMIFDSLQSMIIAIAIRYYPWLDFILMRYIVPKSVLQKAADHYQLALDKIHRRLSLEKQRDDFMTPVLEAQKRGEEGKGMTMPEIESTFSLLIIAGSETLSTTLSGITHHLLRQPHTLDRLRQEIDTAFPRGGTAAHRDTDISIQALRSLPYLNATISESLRLCNPVPAGIPYVVPPPGASVSSIPLPAGTHVSVHPATLNTHPDLYHRPDDFVPERWLSAEQGRPTEHAGDRLGACHPFGLGARICLGKNLAVAELRLVLARLVESFELGFPEEQGGRRGREWRDLKTYVVVKKEPVWVRLRVREGS
ncbi:MAG: hypothetical protein Q9216_001965 [Gyalolechia sp. 2 TL-2023]